MDDMRRNAVLNYGKQTLDDDDIDSIVNVLRENTYLTTGPRIDKFEYELCKHTNMSHCVVVSSGTAALHCAMFALNIQKGDEVLVTTMSFIASANCIVYQGGVPIFVDVDSDTMNIDVNDIKNKITNKTKAIIAVDFAGQLCDYDSLRKICNDHNLVLIEDAAHSLGIVKDSQADLVTFSFHSVKNMTTGEGGAILTNNKIYADRMRSFKNHGVNNNYKTRYMHYYSMKYLGYNYRLTDIQCALGISQINKLDKWVKKRQEIAKIYNSKLKSLSKYLEPLKLLTECAYHIYVIKFKLQNLKESRDYIFNYFRKMNIGVNVHYKPIHLQEYYITNYKIYKNKCPNAERLYDQIMTIPIFPTMNQEDIDYVIKCLHNIINEIKK